MQVGDAIKLPAKCYDSENDLVGALTGSIQVELDRIANQEGNCRSKAK